MCTYLINIGQRAKVGGYQKMTVKARDDDKITVQLHVGIRFYDADGKLVETSTRAGLTVVALLADPRRAFTCALALQQVGRHFGGTGVASR
jgi:hypothetical protein